METFIDLTEFISNPSRSGIQRVCGELCAWWPEHLPIAPVIVTNDSNLVRLPSDTMNLIKEYFRTPDLFQTDIEQCLRIKNEIRNINKDLVKIDTSQRLLVPELFYDQARFDYYNRILNTSADKIYFLVFDLIPWICPQFFPKLFHRAYSYPKFIQTVTNIGFISKLSRHQYNSRLLRSKELVGEVFHLGSDGLGNVISETVPMEKRGVFTVLSTIEPRKNHGLILDAFEEIWTANPQLELQFIGKMAGVDDSLENRIRNLAHPNFKWYDSLDDLRVKAAFQSSLATIFVSAAEGFGLPPVESLWLGVPAIVTDHIPSIEDLGDLGLYRIRDLSVESLTKAVLAFLNDEFLEKKKAEIKTITLPTWKNFAATIAQWVNGS